MPDERDRELQELRERVAALESRVPQEPEPVEDQEARFEEMRLNTPGLQTGSDLLGDELERVTVNKALKEAERAIRKVGGEPHKYTHKQLEQADELLGGIGEIYVMEQLREVARREAKAQGKPEPPPVCF